MKKKNNHTLKQIGEELIKAESVLIFPHILMDGDALGSAIAMCIYLRRKGKKAYILIEDKLADYLAFLDKGYCTSNQNIVGTPDISLCIDCGDEGRFPKRKERFWSAKKTICIDHHPTSEGIADLNYIDGTAGATGEIVYDLLNTMKEDIDIEMARAIYTAIITDTGNFQYSNTTKKSHEIVIHLMDIGIDCNEISVALYENETMEKIMLQGQVLSGIEKFADGQGVLAVVTRDMLKDNNASMEDSEGLVGKLRSIKGVEIALLFKETDKGEIKVAMRAKSKGDVSVIAAAHNGGGHVKAAGCTINDTMENTKELMKKEVTEALRQ